MSTLFKAIGLTIIAVILFMGGCRILVKSIFNRTDCERFNIDNIEVRTGINVPATAGCDCASDGIVKTSTFTIDQTKVDLDDYIERQGFKVWKTIYRLSDTTEHTAWTAELNKETAELSFVLHYLK